MLMMMMLVMMMMMWMMMMTTMMMTMTTMMMMRWWWWWWWWWRCWWWRRRRRRWWWWMKGERWRWKMRNPLNKCIFLQGIDATSPSCWASIWTTAPTGPGSRLRWRRTDKNYSTFIPFYSLHFSDYHEIHLLLRFSPMSPVSGSSGSSISSSHRALVDSRKWAGSRGSRGSRGSWRDVWPSEYQQHVFWACRETPGSQMSQVSQVVVIGCGR